MEKRTVGSVKSAISDEIGCLLEAQLRACDEMIALSQNEQQVLMDRRPSALPELVVAQGRCAEDLSGLEESLRETLIAWEAGVDPVPNDNAPPSLSQLLPDMSSEDRRRIETLQRSLWSRVRTLRMLNQTIALLIKSSLAQADAWLSVLTDMTDQNPAYDASGQVSIGNIGSSRLLDQQA